MQMYPTTQAKKGSSPVHLSNCWTANCMPVNSQPRKKKKNGLSFRSVSYVSPKMKSEIRKTDEKGSSTIPNQTWKCEAMSCMFHYAQYVLPLSSSIKKKCLFFFAKVFVLHNTKLLWEKKKKIGRKSMKSLTMHQPKNFEVLRWIL